MLISFIFIVLYVLFYFLICLVLGCFCCFVAFFRRGYFLFCNKEIIGIQKLMVKCNCLEQEKSAGMKFMYMLMGLGKV